MRTIDCQTVIEVPRDQVFAASQDAAARQLWDGFTRAIDYSAPDVAAGVLAVVRARSGLSMTVRFVKYDAPLRAAIVMVEGPWFIREFAGSWEFRPQGSESCRARFRYSVSLLPVFVWSGLDRWVVRAFERDINARLQGLKDYCETHSQGKES